MTGDPEAVTDRATQVFAGYRELLFSIVYNLLGNVADTDDVLQETWLAWASARHTDITNTRGYLVRIAVNEALSKRRKASRSREAYVGPWLPEPVVTDGAEHALLTESVSMGLLVVLETLTPVQRAVFVLHEAFGYPHTEIAKILARPPAAVRQIAHRAREHVQARRPRYQPDPRTRQLATERFLAAALGGDLSELMNVLAPDVTLWTDGGGKRRAARRPITGRAKVARLLTAITAQHPPNLHIRSCHLNGDPAALLLTDNHPYATVAVDLNPHGDQIHGIYAVTNPDKLTRLTHDTQKTSHAS